MDAKVTSPERKKPSPEKPETTTVTDEKQEKDQKNNQEAVGSELSSATVFSHPASSTPFSETDIARKPSVWLQKNIPTLGLIQTPAGWDQPLKTSRPRGPAKVTRL
ncbi:hypothetical protein N7488_007301 [Penicillium malachiteum]|nr:hypothetical protein N7488_007301 [Penicillium malachiteum]